MPRILAPGLARAVLALSLLTTPAVAQFGLGDAGAAREGDTQPVAVLAEAPEAVLYFDVDGGIESVVGDGRFVLQGKLRMKDEGGGALASADVIDQFWRYTSVDPPNVFGDNTEQRFASVLILPDESNGAWNQVTKPMRTLGTTTHARLYPRRTLHTNKHFYVLGSPEGRFRLEQGADGGIARVTNRLTDGWAADGWDLWSGYDPKLSPEGRRRKWAEAARRGLYGPGDKAGDYSWFPAPFESLVRALELMKDSPYQGGELARTARGTTAYSVRLADFQTRFETLLTTLEPSAKELWYQVPAPSMRFTRRVRGGVLHLSGTTGRASWTGGWGILRKSGTLTMTRELEVEVASGRVRRDALTFSVQAGSMLRCEMKVGFEPVPVARAD